MRRRVLYSHFRCARWVAARLRPANDQRSRLTAEGWVPEKLVDRIEQRGQWEQCLSSFTKRTRCSQECQIIVDDLAEVVRTSCGIFQASFKVSLKL